MSLYGQNLIKRDALKRWVNSLNMEDIFSIDIGGETTEIEGETRKFLCSQLEKFKEKINQIKDDEDWRKYQGVLSPLFYNAFIRVDNSSIKIGNFFECFIEPCNVKTYKKILKGFDYKDTGEINIFDSNENQLASIGMKSDLIWHVFYDYFINENENGSIDHVYSNHEKYLSIQLFDVENKPLDEIKAMVNEILLYVSMTNDMEFKIFEVEPFVKSEGDAPVIRGKYVPIGFEEVPMYYLINANNTNDERYRFLNYYQVIEYFFVRAQNCSFLDNLRSINLSGEINHSKLRKILDKQKKYNERESLKLVLKWALDIQDFKNWLNSNAQYISTYCEATDNNIDLLKNDDKIVNSISDRIYKYRCAIAHAKGDIEEYIAVPYVCKDIICAELPLVKYVAYEVIKKWSGR